MSTKAKFIATIRSQAAAGVETAAIVKKLHDREVSNIIEMVFDSQVWLAAKRFFEKRDPSVFDNYIASFPDPYTGSGGVDVNYDKVRGQYYSILPVPPLQLPENASIRHVGPLGDHGDAFYYQSVGAAKVLSNLEVSRVTAKVSYTIEGMCMWYSKNFDGSIEKVSMKLLPHFSDVDDNQQIFLPMGTAQIIFQDVANVLTGRMSVPEPVYNNSNAKQR